MILAIPTCGVSSRASNNFGDAHPKVLLCAIAAIPGNRDLTDYLVGSMGFLALGTGSGRPSGTDRDSCCDVLHNTGGIKPNISNFGADQFDSRSSFSTTSD